MPIFGGERVGLFHGVAVRYIETLPLFRGKHSGFFGKRTDMIERRFKFIWSRTWPDREQDFVAAIVVVLVLPTEPRSRASGQ